MKLPVLRQQEYLSPSGFLEWLHCEYKYYLKRMANAEYIEEPQSMAAAIGSAFDALLTYEIATILGINELAEYDLKKLIKDSVKEYNQAEAIPTADKYLKLYKEVGAFESLMNEGISELHPATKKILYDADGNEVPIYVKPDFILKSGRTIETKVSGAKSASGVSPKPGYLRCRYSNGKYKGPHERAHEYFENIDMDWATQLTIYHWTSVGMLPFKDIPIGVEQIAVRGPTIAFASFRNNISAEFQQKLWAKLHKAWKRIDDNDIPDPIADPNKCNKWGSICIFNTICPSYQASKDNELAKVFD